jgi:hypothetical protein
VQDGINESSDEVQALISDALENLISLLFVGAFADVKKQGSDSLQIKYSNI